MTISFETKTYVSLIICAVFGMLVLTLIMDRTVKNKRTLCILLSCLFLHTVVNAFSDYFDYTRSSVTWQYILCSLYPLLGFLSLYYYGKYYLETCELQEQIRQRIRIFNIGTLALNLLSAALLIPTGLLFYVTSDCIYKRGPLFFMSYLFVFLEMFTLSVLALLIEPNRKKAVGYISYGMLPLLASIVMLFVSIPSNFTDVTTMISTIILYSSVFQEEQKTALKNEEKLIQYKSDILLSQIGPHFIYNTLSTIAALCTMDPPKAQSLTENFAEYLRTDLSLAKSMQLSPFDTELNHAKKYLEIEKVRFGNRLNVEYDIRETGFELPSLTLQPIVENAVRHGVTKKPGGGTVHITTERRGDEIAVIVADDGVGCDPSNLKPKEGHYGLLAAKDRVQILLGGELKAESVIDQGTTVTILIKVPEKKE